MAAGPKRLSERVLVLNQSYEPISVCGVQKAIILIFLSKAEIVVEDHDRKIRSVRSMWPFPSVIRLHAYIRLPYIKIELSRKNILRRDGHRCTYCGSTAPPLTIDHVYPRSRGGQDTWENLVCACVRCNNRKGNRTPEEAGLTMHQPPRKPSHVMFIQHIEGSVKEQWKPFLFM